MLPPHQIGGLKMGELKGPTLRRTTAFKRLDLLTYTLTGIHPLLLAACTRRLTLANLEAEVCTYPTHISLFASPLLGRGVHLWKQVAIEYLFHCIPLYAQSLEEQDADAASN